MSTAKANRIKIVWIEVYSLKNISILNSKGKNYSWNGVLIVDIWFGEWSWSKYVQGRAQQTKKHGARLSPIPSFSISPIPFLVPKMRYMSKILLEIEKKYRILFKFCKSFKKNPRKLTKRFKVYSRSRPKKMEITPCPAELLQTKARQIKRCLTLNTKFYSQTY